MRWWKSPTLIIASIIRDHCIFNSPFYGLLYTTLPQLTYLKRTDEAFINKQMKPNPVGGEEAGEGALTALGKVIYCIICACLRTTYNGSPIPGTKNKEFDGVSNHR